MGRKKVGSRSPGSLLKNTDRSGNHSEGFRDASLRGETLHAVPPAPLPDADETIRIAIQSDLDIIRARQEGRKTAEKVGFQLTDLALVATAISELARNIVRYARNGEITIRPVANATHRGIEIVARDDGPGIRDIEQVLKVGFSTSGGLGLGLPGVRRLMDDFDIQSKLGIGTTVTAKKWKS